MPPTHPQHGQHSGAPLYIAMISALPQHSEAEAGVSKHGGYGPVGHDPVVQPMDTDLLLGVTAISTSLTADASP